MITTELRHSLALAAVAAGFDGAADPGLRPTGTPGRYAASLALTLGGRPRETAAAMAAALSQEPYIAKAEVTGPGYLTVTVTAEALAQVAAAVAAAGRACTASDALAGRTVAAPPPGDPLAAAGWEEARAALAAPVTARLAVTAGATAGETTDHHKERVLATPFPPPPPGRGAGPGASPAGAAEFAGRDAVLLTLARAVPGKPVRVDPAVIARRVPGNPAYAVRYAHARATAELRWQASSLTAVIPADGTPPTGKLHTSGSSPGTSVPPGGSDTMAVCAIGPERRNNGGYGGASPRATAALLGTLSWLPERAAVAARRGRPDEFARYLEDLAAVTVDVLSSARHPDSAVAQGSDRLALARAARAGLAAGLGLIGASAPDRL